MNNKSEERKLKFGGIYGVTSLTDSTLTLTKLLTSNEDMSRRITFKKLDFAEKKHLSLYGEPITTESLEYLSLFDRAELFHSGFKVENDSITIQTADSVFQIKWKATNRRSHECA